jgi:glycosyltransferase involved in cell wall biosynthesis
MEERIIGVPVKVLQVHNYYSSAAGGEETTLDSERELLLGRRHLVERFEVSNKSVESVSLRTGAETIWSLRSYREMREVIRKRKPDLVHFHNTFILLSPSVYWAAAVEEVPVVQTLHNYRLTCANGLLMRNGRPCEECVGRFPWPALAHRTYRNSLAATGAVVGMQQVNRLLGTYRNKVDAYITPTDFTKGVMVRAGLPPEKVFVKPNFVSDPLSTRERLPQRTEQIVFVGRVAYEKGVDLLLETWKRIDPSNTQLLIIGDGPERRDLMHDFGDLQGVEWRGWLGKEEVLREVSRSRCLVIPSRWYEVFPVVLLEALALGTPLIAPAHGGFPEVISSGYDGFLFTPNDVSNLASVLDRALRLDESSWLNLSKNARNSYLNRFTPEVNYPILMRIYEEAMQRSGVYN